MTVVKCILYKCLNTSHFSDKTISLHTNKIYSIFPNKIVLFASVEMIFQTPTCLVTAAQGGTLAVSVSRLICSCWVR